MELQEVGSLPTVIKVETTAVCLREIPRAPKCGISIHFSNSAPSLRFEHTEEKKHRTRIPTPIFQAILPFPPAGPVFFSFQAQGTVHERDGWMAHASNLTAGPR